jgi:hypothetical protein
MRLYGALPFPHSLFVTFCQVLQSLTKGARLDEFTLVEAAAGLVYILVSIVDEALLPAALVHAHLSHSALDDSLFAPAVALLPQGQQKLLVAVSAAHARSTPAPPALSTLQVKKHLRHLAQHVAAEQLQHLVRHRCAVQRMPRCPCVCFCNADAWRQNSAVLAAQPQRR